MTGRNQWKWRPRPTEGPKPPRHQTLIQRASLGHYTVHLKTHPDTIIGHLVTRDSVFYDAYTTFEGVPYQKVANGFSQEICRQRLWDRFGLDNPLHPQMRKGSV